METTVLTIENPEQFERAVERAVEGLRAGEVAALPTETVYGLAANALDRAAVDKIFKVKGRPPANPIIVHVASISMARTCTSAWNNEAQLLAEKFWPGPLTMVLPKSSAIPANVTAGGDTVGIRCPAHPFMRAVIQRCGFPLAAPSANPSNEISPTRAEHVLQGLGGKIPLVIDAGAASVGIESTVVDLTSSPARVLRPGMITSGEIARLLKQEASGSTGESAVLKSPGLLRKHYSPRAPLHVVSWHTDSELERIAAQAGVQFSRIHVLAHERIPEQAAFGRVSIIPHDPEAYARALYSELHRSDELGAGLILVEAPPAGEEWEGIRDRLKRASADC
jgi:L-threonylcarbamoyladenylate synthase